MRLKNIKIDGLQELYNKFEEVENVVNNRQVNNAFLDSADELSQAGFTEAQPMVEKILGYVKK